MFDRLDAYAPHVRFLLRVVVGLLFLEHGSGKLLGFPHLTTPMPHVGALQWYQGIIELVGGALIVLGLFTRPVAFILCGDMAFAYFMAHAPRSFFPAVNGGDGAILFCFIFLYFFAVGPGLWSVDAAMGGRRR